MNRKRVVIVGGGFGGLNAAKKLKYAPVRVTLIDKSNHHLFQPLLYQVATAALSPADVAMPIRHILRTQKNTEVVLGEVVAVDTDEKRVLLQSGEAFPYDWLIVATGATHSYFGHSDWAAKAHGLKSIEDAIAIRGQILAAFEEAELAPTKEEQRKLMTFILVGGGPTGVEMAGAISEIATRSLDGDFRHIDTHDAQVILVEAGPRVLSAYPSDLSEKALVSLRKLRVDVRLDTLVQGIDESGVDTSKGRMDAHTVIWTAGVQASPVAKWLCVDADKAGRVKVRPNLSVPQADGVFVIGDGMTLDQDGRALPGVAQVAIQQGKYVAEQIAALSSGHPFDKPFRYRDLGSLATIGRSKAICELGKIHLWGWIAWVIWLFVHIMNLVGFRAKLSVLLQWAWAYVTWDKGARLITSARQGERDREIGPMHDG